jgi:CelD/BcsL family acetyltransferase involved in cellulose biosynthesis
MKRTITVVTALTDSFLDEWEDLWRSSEQGHFFNSPSWFLACHDAKLCSNYQIYIQRCGNKLEAVLPLVPEKKYGMTTLMCPGGKFLDKSSLLLADPSVSLSTLYKKLNQVQQFSLDELTKEQCERFHVDSKVTVKESSSNPYIVLTDDPFVDVSKKQKSKICNKIKKNEPHLQYRSFQNDEKALELVFGLEKKSYKSIKGKATFMTPVCREFLRDIASRNKQNVRIDVLFYDGVPCICGVGFCYKKTYHAFYTSHDVTYRWLSPGKLLLYYLLRQLKDEGVEVFDFSRGKNTLKDEFTKKAYKQYTLSYSQNYLTTLWWQAADTTYEHLLDNAIIYGTYCQFKRLFYAY